MKIFLLLILNLILTQPALGAYEYKVKTGDVGTIHIKAENKPKAFQLAANECFNRRVALFELKRGPISEERMLDIIDSCANLKW